MKKVISLLLVGAMAISAVPMTLATTDYTNGTAVEYTADNEANTAYTITVPALLAPGAEGTVKLEGTWASNATVKVTADAKVTLTNSINSADQKVLDVTFAGIEKAGDNTATVTATEAVSVADIENALFGTWSGKFNYNVEYVELVKFTINHEGQQEFFVEEGMTWKEWVESGYNTTRGTEHEIIYEAETYDDETYEYLRCNGDEVRWHSPNGYVDIDVNDVIDPLHEEYYISHK